MREYEGDEILQKCLEYLMQVQRAGGSISIKTTDRKYLMMRLYKVRAEYGWDDVAITPAENDGEIWLTKLTNPLDV